MSPAAAAAGFALEETVNETKTRHSLPPIVVRKNGAERIVRDGEGEPIVLDFDALVGEPAHYAVGVDNADIVATCDTLEEALEAAARALEEPDTWRVDLEITDGELNPLPLVSGRGIAVFVLFEESSEEEEEDVPEEVEWYPVEGAPWEDLG